jgi:uncharacterized protein
MISEKNIQEATEKLVKVYQPLAIYLFGSYAWGEPTEDSDIDLYIILPKSTEMNLELRRKGSRALFDMGFPIDFLFNHRTDFNKRAKHPSTLERKIKSEGKIIYNATTRRTTVSG